MFPIIWAESVAPDGRFEFRSAKKNHLPYFEPDPGDEWLITNTSCVLVQRTTAKEQRRRLIAAELPEDFLLKHGSAIVENHLNMVRPLNDEPFVSAAVVAALLNSGMVDEAFRCISGSVAVSASELEALPFPDPARLGPLEAAVRAGSCQKLINEIINNLYLDKSEEAI